MKLDHMTHAYGREVTTTNVPKMKSEFISAELIVFRLAVIRAEQTAQGSACALK